MCVCGSRSSAGGQSTSARAHIVQTTIIIITIFHAVPGSVGVPSRHITNSFLPFRLWRGGHDGMAAAAVVWATHSPHIGEYERTCCPRAAHTLERIQRHISYMVCCSFFPSFRRGSFLQTNEWMDLMAKRCSFALRCIRALCSSYYCISNWPLAIVIFASKSRTNGLGDNINNNNKKLSLSHRPGTHFAASCFHFRSFAHSRKLREYSIFFNKERVDSAAWAARHGIRRPIWFGTSHLCICRQQQQWRRQRQWRIVNCLPHIFHAHSSMKRECYEIDAHSNGSSPSQTQTPNSE